MKVTPQGPGCIFARPLRADGVPMLKGRAPKGPLTVMGEASFRDEKYYIVHHLGEMMFVYQKSWDVVPGTEIPLRRETPLEKARRLWPRSKKALRAALSFAQFLAQVPQSQPSNGRLIKTLEETLGLWNVGRNRVLVESHLGRALRPLEKR